MSGTEKQMKLGGAIGDELAQARRVTMPFGKHRGRTLGAIADADVMYLDWLVGQYVRDPSLMRAIELVHESEAGRIIAELE